MNILTVKDSLKDFVDLYFGDFVDLCLVHNNDDILIRKTISISIRDFLNNRESVILSLNKELDKTMYVKRLKREIEDLKAKLADYRYEEISKENLSEL